MDKQMKPLVIEFVDPKIDSKADQDVTQDQDQKIKDPPKVPGLIWNSFGVGFSFIGFVIAGVMTALTGSLFQEVMFLFYAIMLFITSFLLGNKLRHKYSWKK